MIFFISLGVYALLIGVFVFTTVRYYWLDSWPLILTIALGFLWIFVVMMVGNRTGEEYIDSSSRIDLVALNTGQTDDGGYFFLGSGVVDNKPIYNYLTIDSEGYIVQDWEYTADSRVNEDGGESPYVETVHYALPSNIWVPWNNASGYTVDFHIPVGSVQGGFYNVELGTDSN